MSLVQIGVRLRELNRSALRQVSSPHRWMITSQ